MHVQPPWLQSAPLNALAPREKHTLPWFIAFYHIPGILWLAWKGLCCPACAVQRAHGHEWVPATGSVCPCPLVPLEQVVLN